MPSLWLSRSLSEHPFMDDRPPKKFPQPFDTYHAVSGHSHNPFRKVERQYGCHIPHQARYSNPYVRGRDRHICQPQDSSPCYRYSHAPPIINQIQISGSNGGAAPTIHSGMPFQYRNTRHSSRERNHHFTKSTDGFARSRIDASNRPRSHRRSQYPFGEEVPFSISELDGLTCSDISSENSIDSRRHHHSLSARTSCGDLDFDSDPFNCQPYPHHRHHRDHFCRLHDCHRHSTYDRLRTPQHHTIGGREVIQNHHVRRPRQHRSYW